MTARKRTGSAWGSIAKHAASRRLSAIPCRPHLGLHTASGVFRGSRSTTDRQMVHILGNYCHRMGWTVFLSGKMMIMMRLSSYASGDSQAFVSILGNHLV